MEKTIQKNHFDSHRRARLHELLIALLQQQQDLELLDSQSPNINGGIGKPSSEDPARWLDRNRRVLDHYRALVRTAVTLDALLDAE